MPERSSREPSSQEMSKWTQNTIAATILGLGVIFGICGIVLAFALSGWLTKLISFSVLSTLSVIVIAGVVNYTKEKLKWEW